VLASEVVSEEAKASLKAEFESLDPVALLRHLDRLLDELWAYAYREPVTTLDLDGDRLSADGNQSQVAGVSRPEAGRPIFESMPEQAALQTGGVQLAQPRRPVTHLSAQDACLAAQDGIWRKGQER
jgi:hypothetical protein